jgi:hypothetical protein
MPLGDAAKSRRYLAYDLNSDGVPEYFVENHAGAHSVGFALVDSTGKLLTHKRHVGGIGGDRLVVLSSTHNGYHDIACSYCSPGAVRGRRWEFDGKMYVQKQAFEYGGADRSKAYVETDPGSARAYWYADAIAWPPKKIKAAGEKAK